MPRFKSRTGFSLVEVMVAMVIVATIAIVSARSFVSMKKSEVGLREADICKSYLDSAFKNIDAYGAMPTLMDTTTIAQSHTYPPAGSDIKGVQASAAFPLHSQALVSFSNSSQLTRLTTPAMLGGTIAMLNGIYHDNSSTCDTTIIGNSSGLLPQAPPEVDSAGITSTMTLTPFDLSTGADHVNCSTDLKAGPSILAPKGATLTHTSAAATSNPYFANADLASNVYNDVGFHVKLAVSFATTDGRMHSCNATHSYSYPADLSPPLPPDILSLDYENSGSEAPRIGPHTVTLNIGYSTATPAKPGVVLMCKDISTANHDPGDNIFAPNGNPFMTSFHPPLGDKYTPCEWVTLCGKSQKVGANSRATFASTGNYQHFTMNSVWPNNGVNSYSGNTIPANGCIAQLQIIAVDMAGNTSNPVTTPPKLIGALQDCAGAWTTCSGSCGANNGTQTWYDTWEAQYQGAVCPTAVGTTRSCTASICPIVNCAGSYGPCTPLAAPAPSCGVGSGQEFFNVTTPPSGGGAACPAPTISCSASACPPNVDCVGNWSTCTSACGTSCQETYTVTTAQSGTGANCPAASGATRMVMMPTCPATPTPSPITPTPCPLTWTLIDPHSSSSFTVSLPSCAYYATGRPVSGSICPSTVLCHYEPTATVDYELWNCGSSCSPPLSTPTPTPIPTPTPSVGIWQCTVVGSSDPTGFVSSHQGSSCSSIGDTTSTTWPPSGSSPQGGAANCTCTASVACTFVNKTTVTCPYPCSFTLCEPADYTAYNNNDCAHFANGGNHQCSTGSGNLEKMTCTGNCSP